MSDRQNILVIQTAFLGDLLLCIPLLKGIRQYYPEFELSIFARKPFGQILKKLKLVDQVFELSKENKKTWKISLKEMLEKKYEYVFCPHNSFRSYQVLKAIDSSYKISFKRWFKYFSHSKKVEYDRKFPDALRQLALLASEVEEFQKNYSEYLSDYNFSYQMDLSSFERRNMVPQWASMEVKLDDSEVNREWNRLSSCFEIKENSLLIAPGSVWATKRWKKEHFLELSRKNSTESIVLIGSPAEQEICRWIAKNNSNCIDISGKTQLIDLYFLMKKSKALISNDSGPMHMAAVASLPSISIFGPTTLDIGYRPWQDKALVCQLEMDCRPCGKHGHNKCPIKSHACMLDLKPSFVQEKLELLNSRWS